MVLTNSFGVYHQRLETFRDSIKTVNDRSWLFKECTLTLTLGHTAFTSD